MRKILLALLAISGLTAGALAFIYWITSEPVTPRPVQAVVEETPPQPLPEPPPPPAPTGVAALVRGPEAPPPPLVVSPAPPKAKAGTWGAVPAVSRVRALGPLAGPVGRGLAELAPLLSSCYSRSAVDPTAELPSLVLSLETRQDEVVVVDAVPLSDGGASDEASGCAIRAVKGHTFRAPGTKPGQRHRLIQPVTP